MEKTNLIYRKLEHFIKKFYINEVVKGSILFLGIGLLYFIFTILIEHFYWLQPNYRSILFFAFILVELFLFTKFIIIPLVYLFNLRKGLDYENASFIIGNHFSEVNDKLINFLQLSKDQNQSELLLASIDQKAQLLQPVPFDNAINFKKNKKYLPFLILPVLIFVSFYISGNKDIIQTSMNRVVNYQKKFAPPAPFEFVILNKNLVVEQSSDFLLKVKTVGKFNPENVSIVIGDEIYFLEVVSPGMYEYRFDKIANNITFHLVANQVLSNDFELKVVSVPVISNFQMRIDFPKYINKPSQIIKGTGNAIVPEGSVISWQISANATSNIDLLVNNHTIPFVINSSNFNLSRKFTQNTDYQIATSNLNINNYEKLNYQINIIKDQSPTISVTHAPDSLKLNDAFLVGQIADDHGFSKLQIVYYPVSNPSQIIRGIIPIKNQVFDQFIFRFPSNLSVQEGVEYEYYFEVFDNDSNNNFKSAKSSVFSSRIQTEEEKEDQNFKSQSENIEGLQKSIKDQNKQIKDLDQLEKNVKQKDNFQFKDQQKMDDFIKRQQNQDELMKEFTKKIQENIDKVKTKKDDSFKEELQKRLENNLEDLEKNSKLLDELNELNKKLKDDELFDKVDKFKQTAKNQSKSLEQLLELTKRFYVEKKSEQIADKLDKLSDKQKKLSENDQENNSIEQNKLSNEFDKIKQDLDELEKENSTLKKPMDLPKTENEEKSIENDMKEAQDNLEKNQNSKAKPKQKSAASKMKELSQKMAQQSKKDKKEQIEEDIKMLRQILDNLLAYSFNQEDLMKQFKSQRKGSPSYNFHLKKQQDLKVQFQHIDDSLFALSLRNPKMSELITNSVGEVHYNIDKSLEDFAEVKIPKAVSHQQYAISSSNFLADHLSNILGSMQNSISMPGMGDPKPGDGEGDLQLPDLIQKQNKLGQKMQQAQDPGSDGKDGDKSNDSKSGDKGNKGEGKQGQGNQKSGNNGNSPNSDGENGSDGEGNASKIMEIYKEQRQLREALQEVLNKKGMGGSGQNVLDEMKAIEKQLLNQGISKQTIQRVLNLKHELLKLDTALKEQGEDHKRKGETNKKDFNNTTNAISPALKDYLNSIEILNRQSLPLRTNFNQKVQEYFKQ